jgi:DNA modification methylase
MILQGDSLTMLRGLDACSVQCCVTSPPYYGLRDYGVDGQLGLESTPDEYVAKMVEVFREVKRVLRADGTVWLNLGDSYTSGGAGRNDGNHRADGRPGGMSYKATGVTHNRGLCGLKPKDLIGIPWRVAFALQADGWYLRQDIIWHKPNPMPESVRDRCTKAHEYIFLLSKSARYYYDADAISETSVEAPRKREKNNGESAVDTKMRGHDCNCGNSGKRNRRSVWTVTTQPFKGAHFAVFPPKLITPCILAGSPVGGTVLDPFTGSGTTGIVCAQLGRAFVGIELNPEYYEMARKRIEYAESIPRQQELEL